MNTIIALKKTGSTMDIARQLLSFLEPPFIVLAESQTSGHGQRNRKWFSPKGGLWYTEVFYTEKILGLSLFISIPILRVLKKYNSEIKVKWPNDLYLNGKKLAGILTKTSHNIAFVGIGINVKNSIPDEAEKYAISLKEARDVDVFKIFTEIEKEKEKLFPVFNKEGLAPFKKEYEDHLIFMHENIVVKSKNIMHGKVLGITNLGELILETMDGIEKIAQGTVLNF
jgi:BirA family biotin operon repressor/biotin-[acetyl-CoA-carboxylase] ligase